MNDPLTITCPSCGALIEIHDQMSTFQCPHCEHTGTPASTSAAVASIGGSNGGTAHQPEEVQWPLEILSHHRYSSTNWIYIIGELRNPYELPLEQVNVTATLYDGDHQVVAVTSSLSSLPVVLPNGRSPFKIGTDLWVAIHSYSLQAQGRPSGMPRQDLVVTNHAHYSEGRWLQVFGEVRNLGQTPASGVRAVVTLYDAAGGVSGTAYALAQTRVLSPGESAAFRCGINHWPDFDHYVIQVQGD
jgi:hypothetical protein